MIAFVFPGQGSQYVGMGKDLAENFDEARKVFEEANQTLGFDLKRLCFEGPEEELKKTALTQPAVLTVSIAAYEVLKNKNIKPEVMAGHSLGEYSALYAAQVLSFADAVKLVHLRGKFMQEAVPQGQGAMAAILGLPRKKVEEACEKAGGIVEEVNINSPGQIVISGEAKAVEEAVKLCKEAGAKRTIPLAVSAPFHSSLMKEAGQRLAQELTRVNFSEARIPVVANVNADYVKTPEQIKESLIKQVDHAVLWEDCVNKMISRGLDTIVEVGPGKVLCGLIRKINPKVQVLHVEDSQSLKEVLHALKG